MSGTTPGVYVNAAGKKTFIPLENHPQVFTDLVHRLGVSSELQFYDIYSVDEPELLSLIPQPVHALVFIAPADVYHRVRQHDGSKELTYDGSGEDEPVIWFKQTIGHACGLIALLHSVCNGTAKAFIHPDSMLQRLLVEALPLQPLPRAKVLYDSIELEQAHMACAVKGDTVPPSSEEPNGYHFISFVRSPKDGHVYELEGSWNGPIDRGMLDEHESLLGVQAIEQTLGRYLRCAEGNVEFSMIALASKSADGCS